MKNLILAAFAGLFLMACTAEESTKLPDVQPAAPVGEVKQASLALTGST